jgi:hypothetical protein
MLLLVFIASSTRMQAATQSSQPTLNNLLQALESNLRYYRNTVPSFFCDEHLVSRVRQSSYGDAPPPNLDTVSDSTFRIKRVTYADQTTALSESRDARLINGQPPNGREVDGPSILRDAFLGGFAIVSLSQQPCMEYVLKPHKSARDPYVITFTSPARDQYSRSCLLQEPGSGQVKIDPASMQITRIELTAPKHGVLPRLPDGSYTSALLSVWKISIDYAPVLLAGETYWLPAKIDSTTKNGYVDWSFHAAYRNYHKLEVTSRILPAVESSAP